MVLTYAVHGVCECVSYLGPALGGGHGALQGKYGMAADQFVSLNIATADGEIITVSEESDDQDLWWAVRGAGHNFGIVTSVTSKVYDVPDGGLWAYEQLAFTGDQVEALFEHFNDLADIQPPGFFVWTYLLRIPGLDPENVSPSALPRRIELIWTACLYRQLRARGCRGNRVRNYSTLP